jgi:hypothetical protein
MLCRKQYNFRITDFLFSNAYQEEITERRNAVTHECGSIMPIFAAIKPSNSELLGGGLTNKEVTTTRVLWNSGVQPGVREDILGGTLNLKKYILFHDKHVN